jgi:hypothetical protein
VHAEPARPLRFGGGDDVPVYTEIHGAGGGRIALDAVLGKPSTPAAIGSRGAPARSPVRC